MVEFADFNHGPMETPMTETTMPLIDLLQKQDDGDFLRAVAEAVLQLLMGHDVEGLVKCRMKSPQKCRTKIPHFRVRRSAGIKDGRLRFLVAVHGVWVAAAA